MTDEQRESFEDSFLQEVERGEGLAEAFIRSTVISHPDAYPFVLKVLNEVLLAGIEANTIGGGEPDALREVAYAIRRTLERVDEPSAKFITVV